VTRDEFDHLIQKLEKVSRKHPRLYTARIVCLVALAYLYLTLILVGSLALCILMIVMVIYAPATVKLAIIGLIAFGGIFLAVLRGLWVKLEAPEGHAIARDQAPKLFALLDELRTALNCKPFHRVIIVNDVNAAVVQAPRLGIFGWHRNYLIIGLPLMQILAPDEFKAVLAHEFAHSSRGHGRFGNWLYRMRRTWAQIFEQMAKRRTRLGGIFFNFFNWFWPVFNGHAFVLARANEYEADACSVRLAGLEPAANALIRTPVHGAFIGGKFWPDIFARAQSQKEPPADVMLRLGETLKAGPTADDAARWLRQSFLAQTSNADTHPCLKDRLRAIGRLPAEVENGQFPPQPPMPPQTAAEFFLGDSATVIAKKMSDEWQKIITPAWKDRHEYAQKVTTELSGMETSADAPPSATHLWEKAQKIAELRGDGAAVTVLEQVIALDPKHAGANFILGRHYLHLDDSRGVAFIEAAMESDPLLTQNGCELLHAYFNRTGQRDKLRPLEDRFDEFQKVSILARQERAAMSAADTFLPHELTEQQIAAIRKVFAGEPAIDSAAVARKKVIHFPKSPCFAVALRIKAQGGNNNGQLVNRVITQASLPGHFLVFVDEKNLRGLAEEVFNVRGSVIYEQSKN